MSRAITFIDLKNDLPCCELEELQGA